MSRTLEQKIADAEARLQRLKRRAGAWTQRRRLLWVQHCWQRSESRRRCSCVPGYSSSWRQRWHDRLMWRAYCRWLTSWRRCQDSDCIVRSPQPQRPSVSERVGEEAEVNPSPGWAHTHGFSVGDMRWTRMNTGFPQGWKGSIRNLQFCFLATHCFYWFFVFSAPSYPQLAVKFLDLVFKILFLILVLGSKFINKINML